MFMIIKRKQIISTLGILVVITAILINFMQTNVNEDKIQTVSESDEFEVPDSGEAVLVSTNVDYHIKAKNDREIVRSKACEILNETIDNPNVSENNKKVAEEKIIKMSENMDKELKCESILNAKGYNDSIVFISDNGITVTIRSDLLSETDIAKINDIIFQETGNNNIKIVEVG